MRSVFVAICAFASSWVVPAFAQIELSSSNDTLTLGIGYDSLRGEVRGRCIVAGQAQQTAGELLRYRLLNVENQSSLYRSLAVSASAKYGAASGGINASSEVSVNRFSSYLFISMIMEVGVNSVVATGATEPRLTDAAVTLLSANPARFREQCGDHFVATIASGGEFTAVVEIATSSDAEKRSVDAQVSGGSGMFSGSAAAKSRFEQITSNKSVKVSVVRGGGGGALVGQEGLAAAILSFPAEIAKRPPAQLRPYRIMLKDYASLTLPEGFGRATFDDQARRVFIENADVFIVTHEQASADAKYALDNPAQFLQFDRGPLQTYMKNADIAMRSVRNSITACLAATQCGTFSAPQLQTVSVPDRIPGPTRAELEARIAKSKASLDATFAPAYLTTLCATLGAGSTMGVGGGFGPMAGASHGCTVAFNSLKQKCQQTGCWP
jgi:hypothetical protein